MNVSNSKLFSKQLEQAEGFEKYIKVPVHEVHYTAEQIKDVRRDYLASLNVHLLGTSHLPNSNETSSGALLRPPSILHHFVRKLLFAPLEKFAINPLYRFAKNLFLTDTKLKTLLARDLLDSREAVRNKLINRLHGKVYKLTQSGSRLSTADMVAIDKILGIVKQFDRQTHSNEKDTQEISRLVQKALFQRQFHRIY